MQDFREKSGPNHTRMAIFGSSVLYLTRPYSRPPSPSSEDTSSYRRGILRATTPARTIRPASSFSRLTTRRRPRGGHTLDLVRRAPHLRFSLFAGVLGEVPSSPGWSIAGPCYLRASFSRIRGGGGGAPPAPRCSLLSQQQ